MYIGLGILLAIVLPVVVCAVGTFITTKIAIKYLRRQTYNKPPSETTETWTDVSGVYPIRRKRPKLTVIKGGDDGTAA